MGKYGTYLEFNGSHEAPKHRKTFGSITQFCARTHFRSPHRSLTGASREPHGSLTGASQEPHNLLAATIFQHGFLSNSEIIFLFNFTREPQRSLTDFFPAVEPYFYSISQGSLRGASHFDEMRYDIGLEKELSGMYTMLQTAHLCLSFSHPSGFC